jgi:hypothetical protein
MKMMPFRHEENVHVSGGLDPMVQHPHPHIRLMITIFS